MVKVNGEEKEIAGKTVADFLKETTYDLKFIAVEINDTIVPKAEYDSKVIEDGDKIEIVSFVGGG